MSDTNPHNFLEFLDDAHRRVVLNVPHSLQKEFIPGNELVIQFTEREQIESTARAVCQPVIPLGFFMG